MSVESIEVRLARMEEKLDVVVTLSTRHDADIRVLQGWRTALAAAWAAVVAGVGFLKAAKGL